MKWKPLQILLSRNQLWMRLLVIIKRNAKKQKASREEILAGLPVVEVPFTVPDEDRNCPYCNAPMEVIGKRSCGKNCELPVGWAVLHIEQYRPSLCSGKEKFPVP